MASKNTKKVNERLALAEQAAASGNFEAAIAYTNAAMGFTKTSAAATGVHEIRQAYYVGAGAARDAAQPPSSSDPSGTPPSGGGGSSVSSFSYPPAPPSTPPGPSWIRERTVQPKTGIKQADPDIILDPKIDTSGDYIVERFFEELGGTELIKLSRHDLIDGIDVVYNPIANLSQLRRRFNPNNIIAIDFLSENEFTRTSIDLLSRGIYEPYFNDDGDLVIEIDIIRSEENIEAEISLSGTVSVIEL